MDKRTRSLLADMLAHAIDARSFLPAGGAAALASDRMRQFAVIRAIEVIGEAAAKVPKEDRDALPQIPWRSLIGMRNILIHGYAELRLDIVAETMDRDMPVLIATLESLLEGGQ